MRILLLSDTHVRDGQTDRLDDRVVEAAAAADLVLAEGRVDSLRHVHLDPVPAARLR